MGKTIQVHGFPPSVTADDVRAFLEGYTGPGTVYALKVSPPRNGGLRVCAIVQFSTAEAAEKIVRLAGTIVRLWYNGSYLRAKYLENDMIPRPRVHSEDMNAAMLYFGCQTQIGKFSYLWWKQDVSVSFGLGKKKIIFCFDHNSKEYKIVLYHENVWQIRLHRPRTHLSQYLVIQLYGAPRIYEIDSSAPPSEDSLLSFFQEMMDDQWTRTVDFTGNRIGQSSSICLELPTTSDVPDFEDNFVFYSEDRGQFVLEAGWLYSITGNLVPIVGPPSGSSLPFDILFKVCALVQHNCLSGLTLDAAFYQLVDPSRQNPNLVENALERLFHRRECCYEPAQWLRDEYRRQSGWRRLPRQPAITLDDGLVYVRRVQVTPCKVYFTGPEVNVSNRVLRNYPDDLDNFLRVSFVDEELDKLYSSDLAPRNASSRTEVYRRVIATLRDGIPIGDKKFEFLAFSSSQLRENSAWFFASRPGLTAAGIRRWMGDFHEIRNVAKYAARLGQSFSSSRETLNVVPDEVEHVPDIMRGGYTFSDGIGKISSGFADRVASKCGGCGSHATPSAFQIRYGGYKGVVAVDPCSQWKLSLRKSMCKFASTNTKLDVLAWSKYQPCYLNRQLITLLTTLGVGDAVFQKKQQEAVAELDSLLVDPERATEALEMMAPGESTNVLKELLACGYEPGAEPFLTMMLRTFRAARLLDLRTRSRIFLPNGRAMMGCLDETGGLKYGEVFVQFSEVAGRFTTAFRLGSARTDHNTFIVEGMVIVAKNPCLHPGDIRVLRAVNIPGLHHMVDCVVFPQNGPRPHPDECSGSDLDGDIYFVCWDPDLIPPRVYPPMSYEKAPQSILDHHVTIEEIEEYFANYILNERLGIIANAHTVFADREPEKAMCKQCVELAQLFSTAVDFPKTGIPAEIPRTLYVREYPDFMDKPDKPTYESVNVIGKLFREVKGVCASVGGSVERFTREVAARCYDPDMEVAGFEDCLDDAFFHKTNYDFKLGNLMDYYGIKTEAELLSGNVIKVSRSFNRKRDSDAMAAAVRTLRKEARGWFAEVNEDDDDVPDVRAKASAWYYVTYHPSYWGCYNEGMRRPHFLSFPWSVYDKLIPIKRQRIASRVRPNVAAFERTLRVG